MTLTLKDPNTIHLGGAIDEVNDMAAGEAITPGHLVELYNNAGVHRYRKHSTAAGNTTPAVALDQPELNKAYDEAYATGDLIRVGVGKPGTTFWMHIASGQNIAFGDRLESAGNGTLRILAAGTALFTALETKANVTVDTMIRVETI